VPVTVTPDAFSLVAFDAPTIHRLATDLLKRLGLSDWDVVVDVDETTPVARVTVVPGSPLVLQAESGALEDPRRPRQLSEESVITNLGRPLLRQRDRASGAYDDAPADADLSLAETATWDAYSVARLDRAGYPTNRQRWLYNFRNRHGFTDAVDGVFAQLWTGADRSWAELVALSAEAQGAMTPSAAVQP
jgi:hypothetical protein